MNGIDVAFASLMVAVAVTVVAIQIVRAIRRGKEIRRRVIADECTRVQEIARERQKLTEFSERVNIALAANDFDLERAVHEYIESHMKGCVSCHQLRTTNQWPPPCPN